MLPKVWSHIATTRFFALSLLLLLSGCAQNSALDGRGEKGENHRQNLDEIIDSPIPGYKAPETISEALQRGKLASLGGDFERAMFEYTQGLDLEGDKSELYFQLGKIHYQAHNYGAALYASKKALEHSDNLAGAHQLLGSIYLKRRDYTLSKKHFDKVLKITKPELSSPVTDVATKSDSGEPADSDENKLKSLNTEYRLKALAGLGIIHDLQKQYDQSESYYMEAIGLSSKNASAFNNYGYSLYLQGFHKMAISYFRQALQIEPEFTTAWRNIGLVYLKQGKMKHAERVFLKISEPYEAYNDLGYLLIAAGKYQEAKKYIEKSIASADFYYVPAYSNLELIKAPEGNQ